MGIKQKDIAMRLGYDKKDEATGSRYVSRLESNKTLKLQDLPIIASAYECSIIDLIQFYVPDKRNRDILKELSCLDKKTTQEKVAALNTITKIIFS